MEARAARMHEVLAESLIVTGRLFGLGGDTWTITHADGSVQVMTGVYVTPRRGPMGEEQPKVFTPHDPSIRSWDLRAPAGYDIRLHDTVSNGTLRYVVLDVAPYEGLVMAPLQELLFYHRADLWRGAYFPATGTWKQRTLQVRDVELSIFPGGRIDITDASAGEVGARDTYTGFCALGEDIRENDQLRNVRLQDGRRYMPDTRFVVSTVATWPQIVALRYHGEQAPT